MDNEEEKALTFRVNSIYAVLKHIKYVPFIFALLFACVMFKEFILILGTIALLVLLKMIYGIAYYKLVKYVLYKDRFKVETGVFSKKIDYLELYRVEDLSSTQPFLLRILGLEHITLYTSDVSTPQVNIIGIKKSGVINILRKNSERMRDIKRVRVFET